MNYAYRSADGFEPVLTRVRVVLSEQLRVSQRLQDVALLATEHSGVLPSSVLNEGAVAGDVVDRKHFFVRRTVHHALKEVLRDAKSVCPRLH